MDQKMNQTERVKLTEQTLDAFLKEQSSENRVAMLNALLRTELKVPGVFPPGTDLSALKPPKPGERLPLPPNVKPYPTVIKNEAGEVFVPAYLRREEIRAEHHTQVVMQMPLLVLADIAVKNPNVTGIAINPFGQNVMLKRAALEAILKDTAKARQNARQMKPVDPADRQRMFRNMMEAQVLPQEFFKDPSAFGRRMEEEEGEFLVSLYQLPFKDPADCPYHPEQFSVMALNIRDELTLTRLDLPAEKVKGPHALRAYFLYDAESGRTEYYTVETTPEAGVKKIFRAKPGGVREEVQDAPDEGGELSTVLDLYDGVTPEEETDAE